MFVNLPLPYNDVSEKDRCGKCDKCVKTCPTGAIMANRSVDANKCISYHTIENKGSIPSAIKRKMDGWFFGCDICQEVCPWNRRVKSTNEGLLTPSDIRREDWQNLTQEEFNAMFADSAIKRMGFEKFIDELGAQNSACEESLQFND
jgi:epoxyqueuosine reductase